MPFIRLGRPKKERVVGFDLKARRFVPESATQGDAGAGGASAGAAVHLSHDELEALRLADLEKLTQEECAEKMGISRRTYWNMLKNARSKLADALVFGKEIVISGGEGTSSSEATVASSKGRESGFANRESGHESRTANRGPRGGN